MQFLVERKTFYPPYPPNYTLAEPWLSRILTPDDRYIPFFFLSVSKEDSFTIIYSHENAEDLGSIYPRMKDLSQKLNVNILAWDYSGYGPYNSRDADLRRKNRRSFCLFRRTDDKYRPSEEKCYSDILLLYTWLRRRGVPPNKIILMGKSLGTGPTIYLASQLSPSDYAGVILISPFTSIVRIVSNLLALIPSLDIFPNIDRISRVKNPVLIFHGWNDEIVPYFHSCQLSNRIPYLYRFYLFPSRGHNDLTFQDLLPFLQQFLNFISEKKSDNNKKNAIRRLAIRSSTSDFGGGTHCYPESGKDKSEISKVNAARTGKNRKMYPTSGTLSL